MIAVDYNTVFSLEEEVRQILTKFDADCDGALNHLELSALNVVTEGCEVPKDIYLQICDGLGIEDPEHGLHYDHLHVRIIL